MPIETILAIETSLDDTCAAVTGGRRVLSNVVASQTAFHEEYGGTVPHIAKRKHQEWIDRLLDMCRTTLNVVGDLVIAACVDDAGANYGTQTGNRCHSCNLWTRFGT